MSNIFYNEKPLVVNPELACLIGLNESIILQQLHYWIKMNKETGRNFHDGHYWTYGTVQEYRDRDFKFWSFETVKRIFKTLEHRGLVITGNFNKAKMDRTKWYAINYSLIDDLTANRDATADTCVTSAVTQMAGHFPSGQYEPMHHGIDTQSNRANCPYPLGQVAPLHQSSITHSIRSDCSNPSEQVYLMQQGILPHAIPEINKEINNQRLAKETNSDAWASSSATLQPATQKAPSPVISGACINPSKSAETANNPSSTVLKCETVTDDVGEVIDASELLFDEFWKLYPRKESKQQAKKAWKKLNPGQELFTLIANALEYRSQTKEWLAEGGRYIPHPASWLNGRRWEDEINPQNICQSAILQEKYADVLIDGKPLDPVQRKQLEYIEKQMKARTNNGEIR